MKAMLLADFGDGPRCQWRGPGELMSQFLSLFAAGDVGVKHVRPALRLAAEHAMTARRWWIVEAKSAEEGRRIVREWELGWTVANQRGGMGFGHRRVLASGGAR